MSDQKVNAKEALANAKDEVGTTKASLRKFKKEHKLQVVTDTKDAKLIEEFEALELAVTTASAAYDALREEAEKAKGTGGVQGSYAYGKILQADGTETEPDATQKKRWRTHARKQGAKDGMTASQVPWDPNYFAPKVKAVKAEKVKAEKVAGEVPAEGEQKLSKLEQKKLEKAAAKKVADEGADD